MITEDKEFIDIENILAKSNLNFNDCTKITEFIIKLSHDNQELKKQLEDMTLCRDIASGHREEVQDRETILLNQQKEFIEYLENSIENEKYCYLSADKDNWTRQDIFKEILSKYKEIIGGKDE